MAKKIKIRPLDDRVVVEPLECGGDDGWWYRASRRGSRKASTWNCRCCWAGQACLDSGSRGELSVSVGDEVIYGKYGGSDIEVDGEEVKILRESDILAKVLIRQLAFVVEAPPKDGVGLRRRRRLSTRIKKGNSTCLQNNCFLKTTLEQKDAQGRRQAG